MTFKNDLEDMCRRLQTLVDSEEVDTDREFLVHEDVLEFSGHLQGLALTYMGVVCTTCNGVGSRVYPSTATWHGGVGGAAMTPGICDKCWGSGRTDKKGVNLRKMQSEMNVRRGEISLRWFEKAIGASFSKFQDAFPLIAQKLEKARWKDYWAADAAKVLATELKRMHADYEEKSKGEEDGS